MRIQANWSGTSSLHHTIRMIGMRWKHRSFSTPNFAGSNASCSRRPAAMAITSCSIERPARICSARLLLRSIGHPASIPKASRSRTRRKSRNSMDRLSKRIEDGATNWMSPSFDPQTKLFYVNAQRGFTLFYLDLNANKQAEGHQGGAASPLWSENLLVAIDFETGKIRWSRTEDEGRSHPGILTTAGGIALHWRQFRQSAGARFGKRPHAVAQIRGRFFR